MSQKTFSSGLWRCLRDLLWSSLSLPEFCQGWLAHFWIQHSAEELFGPQDPGRSWKTARKPQTVPSWIPPEVTHVLFSLFLFRISTKCVCKKSPPALGCGAGGWQPFTTNNVNIVNICFYFLRPKPCLNFKIDKLIKRPTISYTLPGSIKRLPVCTSTRLPLRWCLVQRARFVSQPFTSWLGTTIGWFKHEYIGWMGGSRQDIHADALKLITNYIWWELSNFKRNEKHVFWWFSTGRVHMTLSMGTVRWVQWVRYGGYGGYGTVGTVQWVQWVRYGGYGGYRAHCTHRTVPPYPTYRTLHRTIIFEDRTPLQSITLEIW